MLLKYSFDTFRSWKSSFPQNWSSKQSETTDSTRVHVFEAFIVSSKCPFGSRILSRANKSIRVVRKRRLSDWEHSIAAWIDKKPLVSAEQNTFALNVNVHRLMDTLLREKFPLHSSFGDENTLQFSQDYLAPTIWIVWDCKSCGFETNQRTNKLLYTQT